MIRVQILKGDGVNYISATGLTAEEKSLLTKQGYKKSYYLDNLQNNKILPALAITARDTEMEERLLFFTTPPFMEREMRLDVYTGAAALIKGLVIGVPLYVER